ncbi:MAG TPA: hypothetical protein VFZ78_11245 [Flavisolibacter sp.]
MEQAGVTHALYYRLVALWVVCEAFLGGIIHGFRLPVSGLVVGSSAVVCIALIAAFVPVRGAIIRATLIVAVFKMLLSPHAPFPAYVAVFFQGIAGELIFMNRRSYKVSCFLFAVAALMESGLQRVLLMTVLYGTDLWLALDELGARITGRATSFSNYIIGIYLFVHLLAGTLIGWFCSALPGRARMWRSMHQAHDAGQGFEAVPRNGSKKKIHFILFVAWSVIVALLLQAELQPGQAWIPRHVSMRILVRSVVFVLTWYLFINPLLLYLVRKFLHNRSRGLSTVIAQISALVPQTRAMVSQSWAQAAGAKGLLRIRLFAQFVLIKTISDESIPAYRSSGIR